MAATRDTTASAAAECAELVRRHDRERFATALMAPPEKRAPMLALYAFNHEIAKLREIVAEPVLGQLRLNWWREALEDIYSGAAPNHSVCLALAAAVSEHGLDRARFQRILDGRDHDFRDSPAASLDALDAYCLDTSGALTALATQVLGAADEATLGAAEHVGAAWALTGLLRAIPFQAARGRCLMPADLVAGAGLGPTDFLRGQFKEPMAQVCAAVAGRAHRHLAAARAVRARVPARAIPALLPAVLADVHLARLRRAGYNPFAKRLAAPAPGQYPRLAWRAWRQKY